LVLTLILEKRKRGITSRVGTGGVGREKGNRGGGKYLVGKMSDRVEEPKKR